MEKIDKIEKEIIVGCYDGFLSKLPHVKETLTRTEINCVFFSKSLSLYDSKVEDRHLQLKEELINKIQSNSITLEKKDIIDINSYIVYPDFDVKTTVENKVFCENSLHDGILILKPYSGVFINEEGNSSDVKETLIDFAMDKDKYNNKSSLGNDDYLYDEEEKLFESYEDVKSSYYKAVDFYNLINKSKNMKLAIKIEKVEIADGLFRIREEVLPIDMSLYSNVYKKLLEEYRVSEENDMLLFEMKNRARDLVFEYTKNKRYTPLVKTARTVTFNDNYEEEFARRYNYRLNSYNILEDGSKKSEFRTDRRNLILLDNRKMEDGKVLTYKSQLKK